MKNNGPGASHVYAGIVANIPINAKADVCNHATAFKFLEGEPMRPLASNVLVVAQLGWIAIQLYNSEIVRYYADGTFSVDNCGFNTPTTRQRVDQFTPKWFFPSHYKKQLCGGGKLALTHEVRMPEVLPDSSKVS